MPASNHILGSSYLLLCCVIEQISMWPLLPLTENSSIFFFLVTSKVRECLIVHFYSVKGIIIRDKMKS